MSPDSSSPPQGAPAPGGNAKQESLFARPGLVLVTGASGFVGSHLAGKLARQGYQLRLLVRRTSKLQWLQGIQAELAYGDVRDKASLAGACVGVSGIFHFGAITKARSPREFHLANAQGTRNLAEALAERGTKDGFFVLCSSLAAGGPAVAVDQTPEPIRTESDPSTPITPYGRSKLEAEIALREVADGHGGFRHVILRPSAVYGPRDRDILHFFRVLKHGILPLPGGEGARLSLVYVEDLVDAAIRVVQVGARGTYYISDGDVHTYTEVGEKAAELMAVTPRVWKIPESMAYSVATLAEAWGWLTRRPPLLSRWKVRDMRQCHWVCSSEKARRNWGYEPRFPLERGLEETLTWYRLNQWL